ncbi:MAG: hypothetical protein FWF85_02860 [Clostridiales bacterium]|nr:hypothetical protein [Clostridiales bacterium]
MKCAFIIPPAQDLTRGLFLRRRQRRQIIAEPFFSRRVGSDQVEIVPIRCPLPAEKPWARQFLGQGLQLARHQGAVLFSLEQAGDFFSGPLPENICDGSRYALALFPSELAREWPAWRKLSLAVPLGLPGSGRLALSVAYESRRLFLYGGEEEERRRLAALIYNQTGLICPTGRLCPKEAELVLLPSYAPSLGVFTRAEVRRVKISPVRDNEGLIPAAQAEALILAAGGPNPWRRWRRLPWLEQMRELARKAKRYNLLP